MSPPNRTRIRNASGRTTAGPHLRNRLRRFNNRDGGAYLYEREFLAVGDRQEILAWLTTIHPIWEKRYSSRRALPAGTEQRLLLRPVYWLGNWQFACLGYYEPPRKIRDRAVMAEPFPPVLRRLVDRIETKIRERFPISDVPRGWHLNTCLVNFYGRRRDGHGWVDVARVGEHRDFEPGPVASLSLGERGLFQLVRRGVSKEPPVKSEWLEDSSLQAFAGPWWKDSLLHRVQRVESKLGEDLPPTIPDFQTRRVNFTFRYVPDAHIVPFAKLGHEAREDIREYVVELAKFSPFYRALVAQSPGLGEV